MTAEQRSHFRVASQRPGKLRLGKQTYECTVDNESAGGFAACISQPLHFEKGLQLELTTDSGVTLVQVARCKINESGTFIGLERLKDMASKRELLSASCSVFSYFTGWRRQAEGMTLGNIALIGVCALLGFWGIARVAYACLPAWERGAEANTAFGNVSATYVVESRRSLAQSFDDYLERFQKSRSGQSQTESEKAQQNFARFVRQRLLASNQAAIALGLSREQINIIRAAVMSVEDEVVTLSKTLKTDESELASIAQTRLEAAERESLACLTQDQRLLWATLTELDLTTTTP